MAERCFDAEREYAEAPEVPLTEEETHKIMERVLNTENKKLKARVERMEAALRDIRPHARLNNPGSAALALQSILQIVDGALEESDGKV